MDTRLTVDALSRSNHLPTSVLPVNDSLRSSGEWHSACPTSCTSSRPTVRQLTTPAGTPASSARAQSANALNGVSSDGLMTTVQPAAKAGPIFRVTMADGKLNGVINAAGPTACLMVSMRWLRNAVDITSPCTRVASSAYRSKNDLAYATSPLASGSGFPFSNVMMRARSSVCLPVRSARFRRIFARSDASVDRHLPHALCAAAMALLVSAAPMRGNVATTWPVAGLSTSNVVVVAAAAAADDDDDDDEGGNGTHRPPMNPVFLISAFFMARVCCLTTFCRAGKSVRRRGRGGAALERSSRSRG